MNRILSIDIGGTNQRYACITREGEILRKRIYPHKTNTADAFFSDLKNKIEEFRYEFVCEGAGIALPIVHDLTDGTITDAPNLPFLKGTKPKEIFQSISIPWIIENDANCAVMGEYWKGKLKHDGSLCCLTLGTGVGSGLILNHKLWKGSRGMAAEMGHLKVDNSKEVKCACGDYGCLEAYASGTALMTKTGLSAKELYEKALGGDSDAKLIFENMGICLGRAIASVVNLLNIHYFVIGGQVSHAFEFFYPSLIETARTSSMSGLGAGLFVEKSILQDNAGILGAAYLALLSHSNS